MASTVPLYPPLNHPMIGPNGLVTPPWALFFSRVQSANSGNAPVDAEYLVGALDATLTNERLATNSTSNTWNLATPGQAAVERAALTGDVTASANANVTTIAANAVTFAKFQQIATQRVVGRNTAGTGNTEEVTASQLLDWIGSTRGSVLYRGAAGWAILVPGTSGFALVSNGAGADPSYQAVTADIQTLLDGISTTQGVILYYDGTDWVALSPGISGQFLQTLGAAANPVWADAVTADYVVMSDGANPPSPMDDGNGNFLYMTYTP